MEQVVSLLAAGIVGFTALAICIQLGFMIYHAIRIFIFHKE